MMNWPNKTQRRVLRELAEVTAADGGSFPEERLAKRLDMPVEEVRRHLQALADLGMVEECPEN
jgi:DNA-binding IclR family transcriptional regulator